MHLNKVRQLPLLLFSYCYWLPSLLLCTVQIAQSFVGSSSSPVSTPSISFVCFYVFFGNDSVAFVMHNAHALIVSLNFAKNYVHSFCLSFSREFVALMFTRSFLPPRIQRRRRPWSCLELLCKSLLLLSIVLLPRCLPMALLMLLLSLLLLLLLLPLLMLLVVAVMTF